MRFNIYIVAVLLSSIQFNINKIGIKKSKIGCEHFAHFLCSIGSARAVTVFAVFSLSRRCSVITEQKWNKDHCGTSPGCPSRACESTAVFHIEPKILGPHYCLVSLSHFQENLILLSGVSTFSSMTDNCFPSLVRHSLSRTRPGGAGAGELILCF